MLILTALTHHIFYVSPLCLDTHLLCIPLLLTVTPTGSTKGIFKVNKPV